MTASTHKDRRVRLLLERLLLRVVGRPILCADCGRQLFIGFAVVWRGEVRLIGADDHDVRVSWRSSDWLELRHLHAGDCPAPERPWVTGDAWRS